MKARLLKFIENQGLTASKFADEIGVQRSAISHILSGRNNPGFDFIQKILSRYKFINAEWLIMGTGTMFKEFKQASLFDDNKPLGGNKLASSVETGENTPQKEEKVLVQPSVPEEIPINNTPEKKSLSENHKNVEKIIFFYTDKTFTQFQSNEI